MIFMILAEEAVYLVIKVVMLVLLCCLLLVNLSVCLTDLMMGDCRGSVTSDFHLVNMFVDGLGKVSELCIGSGVSFGFANGYLFASPGWVVESGMCVCLFVCGFYVCGIT